MSQDPELVREIRERQFFHNIDLGNGLHTVGDSVHTDVLTQPGAIPDVRGKSVLDIGAWDGKFSFEAERAGAARVVALDHYVWRLDGQARQAYYDQCAAEGVLPDGDLVEAPVAQRARGYVVPESFTHGSSAQRVRWFKRGFESGTLQQCDTFNAAQL